jgi:hypothetical protein
MKAGSEATLGVGGKALPARFVSAGAKPNSGADALYLGKPAAIADKM